jgi:DNA polymerase-3 subunit delta'
MNGIFGHENILGLLRQTVSHKRPAHAYLFTGREGVGKRLVALRFAAMLNCPSGDGDPSCSCQVCSQIISEKHPDLLFEKPERNIIRIERIRALQQTFKYAPVEGLFRVAIINDAHLMNRAAQNALLKTLEEPPAGRVLILVSSKPGLLLSTVRSRCRKAGFGPLDFQSLVTLLVEKGIPRDKALVAAGMSGGSAAKALQMTQSNFMELREKVVTALVNPAHSGLSGLLNLSAEISANRDSARESLEIAKSYLRDLVVEKMGCDSKIHADLLDTIVATAQNHDSRQLFQVYDEIAKASDLIEAEINVNRNIALDVLFLKIARVFGGPDFGMASNLR